MTASGAVALQTAPDGGALGDERRGVNEKTPLQDQFSERERVWWTSVQQQRRNRSRRMHNERLRRHDKIGVAEFRVITCPIFCLRKNHGAQNFAALHLRGLFLLLCRLGMKRALGLRLVVVRCDRRECAMIEYRNPGADRDHNSCAACGGGHILQIGSAERILKSFLENQRWEQSMQRGCFQVEPHREADRSRLVECPVVRRVLP